jgi:tetratricopeptide (TPR) repeat protein
MKNILILLTVLCFSLSTTINAQSTKYYEQQISECVSKGDYNKAEGILKKWISEVPADSEHLYLLYTNLGTMQRRNGKKEEALNSYNKAYELTKDKIIVLSNRASLKRQLDDLSGSLEDYNNAIEIEENENLLMNRSYTYKLLGDTLACETDLLRVLEISPNNFMAMTNLMNIKVHRGEKKEALDFYNKTILKNPGEPLLYNNRADVRLKLGDYENALIDVNKAIAMEKKYDNAYVTRAEIYIAMGDRKRGLKDLQKAVKLGNSSTYVIELIDECNRYK